MATARRARPALPDPEEDQTSAIEAARGAAMNFDLQNARTPQERAALMRRQSRDQAIDGAITRAKTVQALRYEGSRPKNPLAGLPDGTIVPTASTINRSSPKGFLPGGPKKLSQVLASRGSGRGGAFDPRGVPGEDQAAATARAEAVKRLRMAEYGGVDPLATPEEQAQQYGERVQLQNSLKATAKYKAANQLQQVVMRGKGLANRANPGSGGTIEFGGHTYAGGKTLTGRVPRLPSIEDNMSPEEYAGGGVRSVDANFRQEMDNGDQPAPMGGAGGNWGEPTKGREVTPLEGGSPLQRPKASVMPVSRPDFSTMETGGVVNTALGAPIGGKVGQQKGETFMLDAAKELWRRGTKNAIWNNLP